jgi:hypothetical protein
VRAEAPGAPAEANASSLTVGPLFSDVKRLGEAQSALARALPGPIAALELVVRFDRMLLQARDPAKPEQVIQYEYRAGHVFGPLPVELRGPGELEDNLFPLADADLSSLPAFVVTATRKAGSPDARVSHVVLRRNLPRTFDVRFQAHIAGEKAVEPVQGNARGRLVGPS